MFHPSFSKTNTKCPIPNCRCCAAKARGEPLTNRYTDEEKEEMANNAKQKDKYSPEASTGHRCRCGGIRGPRATTTTETKKEEQQEKNVVQKRNGDGDNGGASKDGDEGGKKVRWLTLTAEPKQ